MASTDRLYSVPEQKNLDLLLRLIAEKRPAHILDVGCGDGAFTSRVMRRCRSAKLYGIDSDREKLARARLLGITVKRADLEGEFPYESGFFDIVYSNMVIEHLDDIDNFVREQNRVLKPGGRMIISTNNAASWHNIGALVAGWMPFDLTNVTGRNLGNPLSLHRHAMIPRFMRHKRLYTARFLSEFLASHGYRKLRSFGTGYVPLPSVLGRIDKTHAQFIIVTGVKP